MDKNFALEPSTDFPDSILISRQERPVRSLRTNRQRLKKATAAFYPIATQIYEFHHVYGVSVIIRCYLKNCFLISHSTSQDLLHLHHVNCPLQSPIIRPWLNWAIARLDWKIHWDPFDWIRYTLNPVLVRGVEHNEFVGYLWVLSSDYSIDF